MSNCDCCDEEEEESEERETYQMQMMAGWFEVSAEGSTPQEAREQLENLWDKGLEDIEEMDSDQRQSLYLK